MEETLIFGPSFISFWVVLRWSSPLTMNTTNLLCLIVNLTKSLGTPCRNILIITTLSYKTSHNFYPRTGLHPYHWLQDNRCGVLTFCQPVQGTCCSGSGKPGQCCLVEMLGQEWSCTNCLADLGHVPPTTTTTTTHLHLHNLAHNSPIYVTKITCTV